MTQTENWPCVIGAGKTPADYVRTMCINYKQILYLDLDVFSKISHYVCIDTPKSEKIQNLKYFWS
jgi:hypothetical protein